MANNCNKDKRYFFKWNISNECLTRHKNVIDTEKDKLNELGILSCLKSKSSSGLLSFNSVSVVGRLNKLFQFWRDTLQAKEFVTDVILNGYKLPLLRYPPRCFISNNKSSLELKVRGEQAISKLLEDECISSPPHCC